MKLLSYQEIQLLFEHIDIKQYTYMEVTAYINITANAFKTIYHILKNLRFSLFIWNYILVYIYVSIVGMCMTKGA